MIRTTCVLGALDPLAVGILAHDAGATPHFRVRLAGERTADVRGAGWPSDGGWTEVVIAANPQVGWRATDLEAPTRLVEALARAPALVEVTTAAVPGFIDFLVAARVADVFGPRGRSITLLAACADGPDLLDLAAALGRPGVVDIVGVGAAPAPARRVAPFEVDPALRAAVLAGRLQLLTVPYAPIPYAAHAIGIPRASAAALILDTADRMAAFRDEVWGGDGSAYAHRLAVHRRELRAYVDAYEAARARAAPERRGGAAGASAAPPSDGAAEAHGAPHPSPRSEGRDAELRAMLIERLARAGQGGSGGTGGARAPGPSASARVPHPGPPSKAVADPARPPSPSGGIGDAFTVRACVPYRHPRTGAEGIVALDPSVAEALSPRRTARPDDPRPTAGLAGRLLGLWRALGSATSGRRP